MTVKRELLLLPEEMVAVEILNSSFTFHNVILPTSSQFLGVGLARGTYTLVHYQARCQRK
jgi:hypothetical protein